MAKPYATLQKAIDQGFLIADLGYGDSGPVVIRNNVTSLYIRGIGLYSTFGPVTIDPSINAFALYDTGYRSFHLLTSIDTRRVGMDSSPLTLYGVVVIGDVICSGSTGATTGANGTNAAGLTLEGVCDITGSVYSDGGIGADGDSGTVGGNGGNAGGVVVSGPVEIAGAMSSVGGAGGADGGMGPGSAGTNGSANITGGLVIPTPSLGGNVPVILASIVNGIFYANTYP